MKKIDYNILEHDKHKNTKMNNQDWTDTKQNLTINFQTQGFDPSVWKRHPLYWGYASNRQGYVVNITTRKIIGTLERNGYIRLSIRAGGKLEKVYAHRFVYECYEGVIPPTLRDSNGVEHEAVIDHIDHNRSNNAIENLRLTAQGSMTDENGDFLQGNSVGHRRGPAKPVWSINLETGESAWFQSMSSAGRYLNIGQPSIQSVCEGDYKTATSKNDDKISYWFCYDDQFPE